MADATAMHPSLIGRLIPSPVAWHVARSVTAALLALGLGYLLQLSSPDSAVITVLIVTHPTHGGILAKSIYRIIGTLVGGVVALVLMGLFAQTPELFLAGFALWLGLCTAASTLLRHFRAYGAVLAGYTVALVGFGAVAHPNNLFIIVMTRVSAVILGVVCSAVVSAVTLGNSASRRLKGTFEALVAEIAAHTDGVLATGDKAARDDAARERSDERTLILVSRVRELDGLIEYAAAESAEIDAVAPVLRHGLAGLSALLFQAPEVVRLLERLDHHDAWAMPSVLREGLPVLVRRRIEAGRSDETVRDAFDAMRQPTVGGGDDARRRGLAVELIKLMALDRVEGLLTVAGVVGDAMRALQGEKSRVARMARLSYHRDYHAAAVNGVRAALAVMVGSIVWLGTEMSTGGIMMVMIAPMVGLLATLPRPERAAFGFLQGTVVAIGLAAFFRYEVSVRVSTFPALALCLVPFLAAGVYMTTRQRWAGAATAYLIFFAFLASPTNPVTYNPEHFVNLALAMVFGATIAGLSFLVLLPVDSRNRASRLSRTVVAAVAHLAHARVLPVRAVWSGRQYDRLFHLIGWLPTGTSSRARALAEGAEIMAIGRTLFRLRWALNDCGAEDGATETLNVLARFPSDPGSAARAARAMGRHLLAGGTDDRSRTLAGLSFVELAHLLNRFVRYRGWLS